MCSKVRIENIPQYNALTVRQLQRTQLFRIFQVKSVYHCTQPVFPERFVQIVAGADLVAFAGEFIA